MPLVNLQKTNIWNSLILQSITSSLIVVLALIAKDYIDKYTNFDENNSDDKGKSKNLTFLSILSMFAFTFIISLIAYCIMYYVFGYVTI